MIATLLKDDLNMLKHIENNLHFVVPNISGNTSQKLYGIMKDLKDMGICSESYNLEESFIFDLNNTTYLLVLLNESEDFKINRDIFSLFRQNNLEKYHIVSLEDLIM